MSDHDHAHAHAHAHDGDDTGRAFAISVALNVTFVVVEVVAGIVASSVALLSDAAHNFGDVLGLLLAWGALRLARRKPSRLRTYGFRRTTILASLANAIMLLVTVGAVSWEAVGRFAHPAAPQGLTMLSVAGIGVVINTGSALMFARKRKADANVRGAFLHLATDAAVSLGVVFAGLVIVVTGWRWIDAAVSLVISAIILGTTWTLLRDATNLALDAVPHGIDPDAVRDYLAALPGVLEVHDLHIWAVSTTETALTAHLVMQGESCHPAFLRDVARALKSDHRIDHSTLQVEAPNAPEECAHAPEGSL